MLYICTRTCDCNFKLTNISFLFLIQFNSAKQEALEWKDRYDAAQIQMNLSSELRNLSIQKLKQLQVHTYRIVSKKILRIFILML